MPTNLETPLFLGTVIYARGNNIPPRIHVRQLSSERGTCSCHGELLTLALTPHLQPRTDHYGRNWNECIIDSSCFIHIPSLKGYLQATASHTEGHCVHMYVWRAFQWFSRIYKRRFSVSYLNVRMIDLLA